MSVAFDRFEGGIAISPESLVLRLLAVAPDGLRISDICKQTPWPQPDTKKLVASLVLAARVRVETHGRQPSRYLAVADPQNTAAPGPEQVNGGDTTDAKETKETADESGPTGYPMSTSNIAHETEIATASPEFRGPSVPIFHRYARSWPVAHDAKKDRRLAETDFNQASMPLTEALAEACPGDQHFVAYADRFVDVHEKDAMPGVDLARRPVRLNTLALMVGMREQLQPAQHVEMQLLVVDVDDPIAHENEAPARAEWRAEEAAKLVALEQKTPGFLRYETRGGYRLIWTLDDPPVLTASDDADYWKDFYVRTIAWLKRETGVEGDETCKDWTRLYRLPNVVREGIGEQRATVHGALTAAWPTDGSRCVAAAVKQSSKRHNAGSSADPDGGDPALVDPLIRALAAALEPAWTAGERQSWFLQFLGWLCGKGWSEDEQDALLDELETVSDDKIAKYRDMRRRAHALEGPSAEVKRALGGAFAAVDKIVNQHPNAKPKHVRAFIERERARHASEPSTESAANDNEPEGAQVSTDATDKEGKKIKGTIKNVANILGGGARWKGVLAYNEFACRVLARTEPPVRDNDKPNGSCIGAWTDAHTARARAWISELYDFEPGKEATDSAVEMVARTNTFHPVREYLEPLVWDGQKRLDTVLATYFGAAAGDYATLIGSKFMISAVARVMAPGCKVDTMLILEGPQGTGKSTAVRVLAGDAWFADTALDFDNKDAAQCLQGKWIYEFGELHSFNRSEVTRIKAFVSSTSDNLRPSYGKRNEDFPRQCVFIGTTNDESYLTDTTGNRRYWPIKCGRINVEALRRDREQLWAEARTRYEAGARWWLDGGEEQLASAEQSARESEDPWEAPIAAWAAKQKGDFTMADVLKGPCGLKADAQTQAAATRAGRLLSKLKFSKHRKHGDAARVYRAVRAA